MEHLFMNCHGEFTLLVQSLPIVGTAVLMGMGYCRQCLMYVGIIKPKAECHHAPEESA
tara:strand:- start:244 stop:417 length:174 start_codon:yes stop_codon:yes gene_type:complete